MDSTITLFEILTLGGALIGVYVKLSGEVGPSDRDWETSLAAIPSLET